MFGIGGFELFIILIFIFLVFGPEKLPEIIGKVGRFAKKFKAAREEVEPVVKADMKAVTDAAMNETDMPDEPFKGTINAFDKAVTTVSDAATEALSEKPRKTVKVSDSEQIGNTSDSNSPEVSHLRSAVEVVEEPAAQDMSFAARMAAHEEASGTKKPEKKTTAKKASSSVKTAPAKKTSAKKTTAQKATAKKEPAKKTSTSAKTASAKESAKKATAKKTATKKAPAKETPAKKTTATKKTSTSAAKKAGDK